LRRSCYTSWFNCRKNKWNLHWIQHPG